MELVLNEQQQMIRDALRDLLQKESSFSLIRALEAECLMNWGLWDLFKRQGWLDVIGQAREDDSPLMDAGIVVHEVSRYAEPVPLVEHFAVAYALPQVLSDHADGLVIPTSVMKSESAGSPAGTQAAVDYAREASLFVVPFTHSGSVDGAWLVERSVCEVTPLRSLGRGPVGSVIIPEGATFRTIDAQSARKLERGLRILTAIQCVAYAEAALERTVEYASMRVQFGRPIGSFQAVQHHCANMATMVSSARFMVYECLWKLATGDPVDEEISLVKAWAGTTATEVTMLAHQIHGGIGFTEEYDLHFFSRKAKERSLVWGTPDELLESVGSTPTAISAWL